MATVLPPPSEELSSDEVETLLLDETASEVALTLCLSPFFDGLTEDVLLEVRTNLVADKLLSLWFCGGTA